jgi:hypothetical protein
MKAYTLKKKNETKELHLFEGDMTPEGCNSESTSICRKMKKSESEKNIFACFNEGEARVKCAQIGRDVCGICVSHLYSNDY